MTETLAAAFVAVLKANAAVAALASTRIFPDSAPQGTPAPYVVYSELSSVPEESQAECNGLDGSNVEFACYADTTREAIALRSAHHIAPLQHHGNGLLLDRCRTGVTLIGQCALDFRRKAKVGESQGGGSGCCRCRCSGGRRFRGNRRAGRRSRFGFRHKFSGVPPHCGSHAFSINNISGHWQLRFASHGSSFLPHLCAPEHSVRRVRERRGGVLRWRRRSRRRNIARRRYNISAVNDTLIHRHCTRKP